MAPFEHWLPVINYENRQGGILTAKALMKEGVVIACEASRHPWPIMHPSYPYGSDPNRQTPGPDGVALGPLDGISRQEGQP